MPSNGKSFNQDFNMFECKEVSKTKQCNMCKQILPIENFHIAGKDGYRRGKCKPCQTEHYQKNKGTWEEYQKEQAFRKEIHLLQKEGKRRCRLCKEIKILDDFPNDSSSRVYYGKKSYCKTCGEINYGKPYRESDVGREKHNISNKKYRSQPKTKKKTNERVYKKYHNDPTYKLKVLLRSRLGKVIKRKKASQSFVRQLGCTVDELVVHLESKFYPDPKTGEIMSWDNHTSDGWHVDHIKPLHEFNLEDDEQFKEAAHYTNLQPLWWWQNLEKNRGINFKKS